MPTKSAEGEHPNTMDEAEITGAIQTIERLIAEKEAVIEKEAQFLRSLKVALNRFGYDIVSIGPAKSPITHEPHSPETQPRRRRGRPKKQVAEGQAVSTPVLITQEEAQQLLAAERE